MNCGAAEWPPRFTGGIVDDTITKVLALNRISFESGDAYNSEATVRAGLESGKFVLLTEPRRMSAASPLLAYCLLKLDKRVLRLERIAVAPGRRNAGIGRALISRARKWRDKNCPNKPIWTYVSGDNTASLNAHVHAGFGVEVIGRGWVWIMG